MLFYCFVLVKVFFIYLECRYIKWLLHVAHLYKGYWNYITLWFEAVYILGLAVTFCYYMIAVAIRCKSQYPSICLLLHCISHACYFVCNKLLPDFIYNRLVWQIHYGLNKRFAGMWNGTIDFFLSKNMKFCPLSHASSMAGGH